MMTNIKNDSVCSVKNALDGMLEHRRHLLVVGDVMLDKYYYGEVRRISPEAPVPVVRVMHQKETLGGAANVAHNLALLGCETLLASYVGDDVHKQSLLDKMLERGIDSNGIIVTDRPTITKLRIIGEQQQMLRLDFEENSSVESCYSEQLLNFVSKNLAKKLDAVIISDYGKGACSEQVCQTIIKNCHTYGVPVFVDPKGTRWNKYAGADYITPNLRELNDILPKTIGNEDLAIEKAAQYVMKKFQVQNLIVTRSEKGLSLVNKDKAVHIPTKAQEVYDVSGAGDTVIAVFALAMASRIHPVQSAYLSNLAASVVIAKQGTYAVSLEELIQAFQEDSFISREASL